LFLKLTSPTPWHTPFLSSYPWKALGEWVGVYQDGFLMFRHKMQELLNIGHFYHSKCNKIKSNSLGKLEALLTLLEKKSTMSRILWRWFFIFKTQHGVDIWIWVVFMNGNSTTLQKLILKGKNSLVMSLHLDEWHKLHEFIY